MGTIKGLDISAHQGSINFSKVKNDGIKFLIIRSSYSTTEDKRFMSYVEGAKKAGIDIKGVYVFSYALKDSDAKKEADYCIKLMQKAGLGKDVIVFYDFEYDSVRYGRDHKITLGPKSCQSFTRVFCERVKELGYTAGVYTNIDYYNNMYGRGKVVSDYVLWLAHYTKGDPYKKCVVQQYSSSGRVSGISGNVDMNKWYGGVTENTTPSTPVTPTTPSTNTSTKKKSTTEVAKEVIAGKWGNGSERKKRLTKAGYDYDKVQKKVNKLLKKKK